MQMKRQEYTELESYCKCQSSMLTKIAFCRPLCPEPDTISAAGTAMFLQAIVLRTVVSRLDVRINRLFKSDNPLDAIPPWTVLPFPDECCPRKETTGCPGIVEVRRTTDVNMHIRPGSLHIGYNPGLPSRAFSSPPQLSDKAGEDAGLEADS